MAFHWRAPLFFLVLCWISHCSNRWLTGMSQYSLLTGHIGIYFYSFHPDFLDFCHVIKLKQYCMSVQLFIQPPPPISLLWSLSIGARNERNLQQKQQLAGGPMSHDALHGECHARHTLHLVHYCDGEQRLELYWHMYTGLCAITAWTRSATTHTEAVWRGSGVTLKDTSLASIGSIYS